MSFVSTCPFCGQKYEVDASSFGQVINCTRCNKAFVIQADDDTVAPSAPDNGTDTTDSSVSQGEKRKKQTLAAIGGGWVLGLWRIAMCAHRSFAKGDASSGYRWLLVALLITLVLGVYALMANKQSE